MMEYGYPRSNPLLPGKEDLFEMKMEYPASSRLYLYLLDNMFSVNIRLDQRGPISFAWSMCSHDGNWQRGNADQFGWQVLNPLLPRIVEASLGTLPASGSFLSIHKPNIVCSTIKPAEANGAGIILRFNETQGNRQPPPPSPCRSSIGSLPPRRRIWWKVDRPAPLPITNGNQVSFSIRPFWGQN